MSELFVRFLPHCPHPAQVDDPDRVTGTYLAEVCGCPVSGAVPVHWMLDDGRPMRCVHGPQNPPLRFARSGAPILTAVDGAVACRTCAQGLYSYHFVRRLDADLRCCYCEGPAEKGDGWYLKKHPPLGVPGARR
ncbi:hypothetical protein [Streptomyces fradiae]|uniref:hypothetical protein n=1 Tax=Streptomyces fradiae TaxID=1906 RepID=UPI0036FD0172